MPRIDMVMPQLGESIVEGTILKWRKQVGERVEKDETLLDISTDKVDSEIPAPAAGVVADLKFPEGAVVAVGSVVAIIDTAAAAGSPPPPPAAPRSAPPAQPPPPPARPAQAATPASAPPPPPAGGEFDLQNEMLRRAKKGERIVSKEEMAAIERAVSGGAPRPSRATRAAAAAVAEPPAPPPAPTSTATATTAAPPAPVAAPARLSGDGAHFFSPLVREIARQESVTVAELETIAGAGSGGRVTKNDLLAYIASRASRGAAVADHSARPSAGEDFAGRPASAAAPEPVATQAARLAGVPAQSPPAPATPRAAAGAGAGRAGAATGGEFLPPVRHVKPAYDPERVTVQPMDRMREMIAEHMVRSLATAAHVTSLSEADVHRLVGYRDAQKEAYAAREGHKLTYTPFFVQAAARALADFPMVNASVDGATIILRKDINIGVAVALPSGGLIVPVVRNADSLNQKGLNVAVNDLAERARQNALKPDDVSGGTFTITNPGIFGTLSGMAVINQPQVAILGIGAIKKRPVVVNDAIAVRPVMMVSLTYDHRIVDGMLGGQFLQRFVEYLENFAPDGSIAPLRRAGDPV
ncbi:MAG: 2-oxo acid dehydrogenase subunit E2 [Planctomycetes bacterium]|nr:2-oxo acid dehydrogenase subunit E2 [Planctomycetota bacterium]